MLDLHRLLFGQLRGVGWKTVKGTHARVCMGFLLFSPFSKPSSFRSLFGNNVKNFG